MKYWWINVPRLDIAPLKALYGGISSGNIPKAQCYNLYIMCTSISKGPTLSILQPTPKLCSQFSEQQCYVGCIYWFTKWALFKWTYTYKGKILFHELKELIYDSHLASFDFSPTAFKERIRNFYKSHCLHTGPTWHFSEVSTYGKKSKVSKFRG